MAHDYFVTEESGIKNLQIEGLSAKDDRTTTTLVGNTMIDSLVKFDQQIKGSEVMSKHGLEDDKFILMTMHRPATVDNADGLNFLLNLLKKVSSDSKVVLPMHPRTRARIASFNLTDEFDAIKNLLILDPLGYFAFQRLVLGAKAILTDSGGIQEESTFRQVPCITLRPNTERPVTCDLGTNQLVGLNEDAILNALAKPKTGTVPPMWDGASTERVLHQILKG
jgi:UDP-N-acetylglucosamine 2-epimerase (non-hydrolysing)